MNVVAKAYVAKRFASEKSIHSDIFYRIGQLESRKTFAEIERRFHYVLYALRYNCGTKISAFIEAIVRNTVEQRTSRELYRSCRRIRKCGSTYILKRIGKFHRYGRIFAGKHVFGSLYSRECAICDTDGSCLQNNAIGHYYRFAFSCRLSAYSPKISVTFITYISYSGNRHSCTSIVKCLYTYSRYRRRHGNGRFAGKSSGCGNGAGT